jgi:molybdopterin converting factor small subunit
MIAIEFYGVPRLRAGRASIEFAASNLGQALRELARLVPALEGTILRRGNVGEHYKLSLNGERFVSDLDTPLADGDVLLLLSNDVGG